MKSKGYTLIRQGKVRDIYEVSGDVWLLVVSDRVSAFDVILPGLVRGKGVCLNAQSNYWLRRTRHIVDNHLIHPDPHALESFSDLDETWVGRCSLVKKARPLPFEFIVRRLLLGSAWKTYQATSSVCDMELPGGYHKGDPVKHPIFTPSTKGNIGMKDVNIGFSSLVDALGNGLSKKIKDTCISLFLFVEKVLASMNLILADTKFEFGIMGKNDLMLIDEVVTADSSRILDAMQYAKSPRYFHHYDKQFLRDYLRQHHGKQPQHLDVPPQVYAELLSRYLVLIDEVATADSSRILDAMQYAKSPRYFHHYDEQFLRDYLRQYHGKQPQHFKCSTSGLCGVVVPLPCM